MAGPPAQEVTQLLQAWSDGDERALEKPVPLVYAELHRLVRRYMARSQPPSLRPSPWSSTGRRCSGTVASDEW